MGNANLEPPGLAQPAVAFVESSPVASTTQMQLHRLTVHPGDYVTLVMHENARQYPVKLYGQLELNPACAIVTRIPDTRGWTLPIPLQVLLVAAIPTCPLAGLWVFEHWAPIDADSLAHTSLLIGLGLGLVGFLFLQLRQPPADTAMRHAAFRRSTR